MNHGGDPQASTTTVILIVGAVLMLAIVLFTTALFYSAERQETATKVYGRPFHELDTLRSEQQANLSIPHWINREKGVVAVTIEQAMDMVVTELKAGPPPATMSNPGSGTPASQPTEHAP